ncbi:MAG TPA: hypothetical protein PLA50_06155 [Bacteroidia bacterium]|nr:hypothetical protein [Bacteroidia bacterium]
MFEGNFFFVVKLLPLLALTALLFALFGWWLRGRFCRCDEVRRELDEARTEARRCQRDLEHCRAEVARNAEAAKAAATVSEVVEKIVEPVETPAKPEAPAADLPVAPLLSEPTPAPSKPVDFKAAVAVLGKRVKENDLKLVEGIGPKIEQLFKDAGISTWAALAASAPERLKEILDAGGDRFAMHHPGTWPAQAALMVEGRWDDLKKYQDELSGGRA